MRWGLTGKKKRPGFDPCLRGGQYTFRACDGWDLCVRRGGRVVGCIGSISLSIVTECNPLWDFGVIEYDTVRAGKKSYCGTLDFLVLDEDVMVSHSEMYREQLPFDVYATRRNPGGVIEHIIIWQVYIVSMGSHGDVYSYVARRAEWLPDEMVQ